MDGSDEIPGYQYVEEHSSWEIWGNKLLKQISKDQRVCRKSNWGGIVGFTRENTQCVLVCACKGGLVVVMLVVVMVYARYALHLFFWCVGIEFKKRKGKMNHAIMMCVSCVRVVLPIIFQLTGCANSIEARQATPIIIE